MSFKAPLVSIITPTYNRSDYLREVIKSVLGQDYARIAHRGCAAARNVGIDLAQGTYVAFLDADDNLLSDKLRVQLAHMEEQTDVLMSHTSYERMDEEGGLSDYVNSGRSSGHAYPRTVECCLIATPTVMVRKRALDYACRFAEKLHVAEDVILWIRIAQRSRIIGIEQALSRVRLHGQNASCSSTLQIEGAWNIIEYTIRNNPALGLLTRQRLMGHHYCSIGKHHWCGGRPLQGLAYAVRAMVSCPWSPMPLMALGGYVAHVCRRQRGFLSRASGSSDRQHPKTEASGL